jgi:hypothetical protein
MHVPHVFVTLQLSVSMPHCLPAQTSLAGVQHIPACAAPPHSLAPPQPVPGATGVCVVIKPASHASVVQALLSFVGSSSGWTAAISLEPVQTRFTQSPVVCVPESPVAKFHPQVLFPPPVHVRVPHSPFAPQSEGMLQPHWPPKQSNAMLAPHFVPFGRSVDLIIPSMQTSLVQSLPSEGISLSFGTSVGEPPMQTDWTQSVMLRLPFGTGVPSVTVMCLQVPASHVSSVHGSLSEQSAGMHIDEPVLTDEEEDDDVIIPDVELVVEPPPAPVGMN